MADFTLEDITVAVGTKVTWVNKDRAPHSTTAGRPPDGLSGEWDSGLLDQSESFSYTFDEVGEYPYFCTLHPYMVATVVVTERDAASSGQSSGGQSQQETATSVPSTPTATATATSTPMPTATSTPEPEPQEITSDIIDFTLEDLTVRAGTTVTWVNRDSASHTTTSGSPPDDRTGQWDSDTLRSGESFSFTFDSPGTFPYFCAIHPFMTGAVTVEEADTAGSMAPSPTVPSSAPYIPPGGYDY